MNIYKPKMKKSTQRGSPISDYEHKGKVGKILKKCLRWMEYYRGLVPLSCGPNTYS